MRSKRLVQLYSTLLAASLEAGNDVGLSDRFARLRARLTADFELEQQAGRVRADVPAARIAALLIAASDGLQIQWLLEPSVGLETTLRTFATLLAPPS